MSTTSSSQDHWLELISQCRSSGLDPGRTAGDRSPMVTKGVKYDPAKLLGDIHRLEGKTA